MLRLETYYQARIGSLHGNQICAGVQRMSAMTPSASLTKLSIQKSLLLSLSESMPVTDLQRNSKTGPSPSLRPAPGGGHAKGRAHDSSAQPAGRQRQPCSAGRRPPCGGGSRKQRLGGGHSMKQRSVCGRPLRCRRLPVGDVPLRHAAVSAAAYRHAAGEADACDGGGPVRWCG